MTDLKHVIDATKRIESILVNKFGARGRGLHEKLSSVERKVPSHLHASIRFIATVRNKAVHEEGFEITEPEEFLRKADWVHAELSNPQVPPARSVSLTYAGGFLAVCIVGVALLMLAGGSRDEAPTSAPGTADRVEPSFASAPRASTSVSDQPNAQASADTTAFVEAIRRGENIAWSNGVLEIRRVEFDYVKGTFGRREPRLTLWVHNASGRTIASASLHARLFIDGELMPVAATDKRGVDSGPLFVYLGEAGLRQGESRRVEVRFGLDEYSWSPPDAINATKRSVAVRVHETKDGLKRTFGSFAPPFPELEDDRSRSARDARASSESAAVQTAQAQEVARAALRARSGALSNAALSIDEVSFEYVKGSFGRLEPSLDLRVRNTSDRTISSAAFHARLYLDGDPTPAVATDDGRLFSEPLTARFGDMGLAPGASVTTRIHFSLNAHRWTLPDAIEATTRAVILRVVETRDGLRRPFGGEAPPFATMHPDDVAPN